MRASGWHPRPFRSLPVPLEFPPSRDRRIPIAATNWSVKDSEKLYNMQGWGLGFFRVNPDGRVAVHPDGNPKQALDLYQLAMDLNAQGVGLPLLLRFSDILRARLQTLATQFRNAITEFGYDATYTTVYPIKVNQQRHVVQEIVEFGTPLGVGLECGSKPELQAVLGITEGTQPIIVCNGYKDEEYMRLALMGQKLGHTVFVVVEQLSEVDTLLKVADELGVEPTMGVRIKLATEGAGRWAKSGGEKSKFGLSAMELMKVLDKLEAAGRKDVLRLVHFHLGSQITDIQYIKAGLEEIGRYYVELRNMGFGLTHVDVGGGLGVDYDGSRSTRPASMNYSMREYANDVVYTLGTVCRAEGVPMPHIISESGRAITAHHSLLLINVTDVESQSDPVVPDLGPDPHAILVELKENLESISPERLEEVHHDATFGKERAQELFASGVLSLRDRANVEQIYLATMNQLARLVEQEKTEHPEIWADIEATLVDRYFCNFSVFQSLPDNWAIDQLFPIMPIHRLDERPSRRGTIQDITCDSDGVIDRFVGGRKGKPSLELHPIREDEPYLLGIFLTGAYQEILGDLHNLFGDTNAVHVRLTPAGYEITDLVHGDTVTEVLNYVQFQPAELLTTFRRKVTNAKDLPRNEANQFIADYVAGLEGYTYLEGEEVPGAVG
ncbi:MAG TPA: biosynthetic arginine decarboxylase [Gemmatimonadales bacterium]|nr:biosynthetic arginine decarboxylase [Gemmatimonadales bacterium]